MELFSVVFGVLELCIFGPSFVDLGLGAPSWGLSPKTELDLLTESISWILR